MVSMSEIFRVLVVPAMAMLFIMFVKHGREIQALKTAASARPKICFERGKWISKIDRRVSDNHEENAVLKARQDAHDDLQH